MQNKLKFSVSLSKKTRANILTGCVVALVYVLLQNFGAVRTFLADMYGIISPFIGGLALAFLLNLIMSGLERLLLHRLKHKKLMRAISLSLSLIIGLLVIAGLLFALIPQLITSLSSLVVKVQDYLVNSEAEIRAFAGSFDFGPPIVDLLYGSWGNAFSTLSDWTKDIAPGLLNTTVKFGSGIVRGIISLFIAIYVLVDKERLAHHAKLVLRAFASPKAYDGLLSAARRANRIFGGFITGKLLDSLIIGILCFIGMLIFQIPNALLISVIVGVTNIIPNFGPFIGAIPSILIIMIDSPIKALYFTIFILVLQQIDGNLLGPLILGDSTGLSALWVLIAICFFGALWGLVGMLVGVPLVAICYVFAAEYIAARLEKKGYDLSNNPLPARPAPVSDGASGAGTSDSTAEDDRQV